MSPSRSDFNHGGGVIGWNERKPKRATSPPNWYGAAMAEADIAKLWSGNVLRIWSAALAATSRP
jgi:membrane dipeptidase